MTPMEQFIRQYSASIGLNPEIIMQTVLNEGGRQSLQPAGYARRSLVGGAGSANQEPSYGPFQMHMKHLGARALAAGFDPRDPTQAFNVAKFAMDEIKRAGLGQWHGWKGDPWAAHGGKPSGETVAVPSVDTASGVYDPRRDTPSTGNPTGAEVSNYALNHPVGPQGDDVTISPYNVPNSPYELPKGTADDPLVVKTAEKNPFEKVGAAVAKMGDQQARSTLGPITNVPNPAPTVLPPMPTVDPASSNNARNALVAALMRVNSGQLWPMGGMGGGIG